MVTELRQQVYDLINAERERQHELGKPERNTYIIWYMAVGDYLGRVANIMWNLTFRTDKYKAKDFLPALVKVGALLVAWLENSLEDIRNIEKNESEQTEEKRN